MIRLWVVPGRRSRDSVMHAQRWLVPDVPEGRRQRLVASLAKDLSQHRQPCRVGHIRHRTRLSAGRRGRIGVPPKTAATSQWKSTQAITCLAIVSHLPSCCFVAAPATARLHVSRTIDKSWDCDNGSLFLQHGKMKRGPEKEP